ncbi:MAG: type 1 glutamine amidotransferase [Gammaproteobacteria bacterium]|nr:type 1 glutamine amidotransferase [Gammaproteobacteria bacterium]
MHPIVIFRHAAHEGPGYFAEFLDSRRIPYRLVRVDRNDPVPESLAGISGLAFMGGSMSVNDPLPWIAKSIRLIQHAIAADVPVLGHCLGGQLLAKALGAKVVRNRVPEIGWLPVDRVDSPTANAWLNGLPPRFEVFHWHGETFEIPTGATPILRSRACQQQAFVIGKHLGFQCHIEMTPALVRSWTRTGAAEIAKTSATVHSTRRIHSNLVRRAAKLNRVADRFYERWIRGLR